MIGKNIQKIARPSGLSAIWTLVLLLAYPGLKAQGQQGPSKIIMVIGDGMGLAQITSLYELGGQDQSILNVLTILAYLGTMPAAIA